MISMAAYIKVLHWLFLQVTCSDMAHKSYYTQNTHPNIYYQIWITLIKGVVLDPYTTVPIK